MENDKKRFKAEAVNGEEKELLYSKPAYETGGLLETVRRNTRRSRRLMDLDYESDSESRTSGYECEGNSDEDSQPASTWHGKLRRQKRVIDDDDDDDGVKNGVESRSTEEPKVREAEQNDGCRDDKEEKGNDEELTEPESEQKKGNDDETVEKPDGQELKTDEPSKESRSEKVASSGSETEAALAAGVTTSQPQTTALPGNKIHPHSRIASVAPVARAQPVANSYRTTTSYPPEGVFPNPPNFDMIKPQFPAKQTPSYIGSNFGGANIPAANLTGSNFTGTANLPPSNAPGVLQSGTTFPGAQGVAVPNTRTNFGATGLSGPSQGTPNFSAGNLNFPNANLAGQNMSGANFGGSFVGGLNNLGTGVGTNFGGATNFGGSNTTVSGTGGSFGTMKNPTQNVSGSFWGGQNELNSLYNYQGFPQSAGATSAAVTSPANNQTLPPPYPSAAQFAESSQYGGYNQQFQANSNAQNNYISSQLSGNFPDSTFFPVIPQQPPPPYSANNSLNANFYANTSQEGSSLGGNQWSYPEGYGYYPGQGSAAGQSF